MFSAHPRFFIYGFSWLIGLPKTSETLANAKARQVAPPPAACHWDRQAMDLLGSFWGNL